MIIYTQIGDINNIAHLAEHTPRAALQDNIAGAVLI